MPADSVSTPHRSRRRKDPKTSEKENSTAAITKATRSRKPRRNDLVLKDCDNLDFSSQHEARFEAIVETTSSASFWKHHASLAEFVLRASQSLYAESSSCLVLEEQASELQNICRTYVKDATQEETPTQALKLLYVAIHGLRAICPTMSDPRKCEASMKILYHAITTAGDVCVKAKDLTVCIDAASQCCAALQALGSLLNGYKLQFPKATSFIRFKLTKSQSDLFPIPSLADGKASGSTMTVNQVFKIALQAAISVANSLMQVHKFHIHKTVNVSSVSDFGSYTLEILKQTFAGHETISRIVQEVIVPWSCFLSSSNLETTENVDDCLTYSKRSFRLLFDVASQIDKSADKSSAADILELRKQAILAFLLSSPHAKISLKMQRAVKENHWEGACTYACKASLAYRQHLPNDKRGDEPLNLFHKHVGAVLDAHAPTDSLGYIEYAAYRALHVSHEKVEQSQCQSKNCVFGQLAFPFLHKNCFSSSFSPHPNAEAGEAVLAVLFLVLRVQKELDASCGHAKIDGAFDLERLSDLIIARFRSVFLKTPQMPSTDVMSRCYKLLEALALNRKVYQILSNDPKGDYSRAKLMALNISGRVLSECIGPFALTLMKKKEHLVEVAVDSYVRGLAAFDCVRKRQLRMEAPICTEIFCRTDLALCGLFALWDESGVGPAPSEESLEKAAKTIFAIGRVRCDKKEYRQALLPLCLGADLFSRLAERRGLQSVRGLQMSMRYSHLSFTFSSLDMINEACLALVLAIIYDLVDSIAREADTDDDPVHLLRYLSGLTNGAVYMGTSSKSHEHRRALVSRLVRLFGSRTSRRSNKSPLMPCNSGGKDSILLIRHLLRDSAGFANEFNMETSTAFPMEEGLQMRFGLAALLSSTFNGCDLFLNFNRMNALRTEQLLTVADVLAEDGSLLQQDALAEDTEPDALDIWIKDFTILLQFLESLNKSKFEDDPIGQVSLALIHVLAAASLVSTQVTDRFGISEPNAVNQMQSLSTNTRNHDVTLLQARRLVSKANGILMTAVNRRGEGEHRLAASALLGCTTLYAFEISTDTRSILAASTKSVVLNSCREAIILLGDEMSKSRHETMDSFRLCLTRTLTRFQDRVNLEGDKLLAAQAAILVFRLHEESGHGEGSWYRATAGNLLQDGRFLALANNIVDDDCRCNTCPAEGKTVQLKDLLQLELFVSRLRLKMCTVDVDAFNTATREVKDLLNECSGVLGRPELGEVARVLIRWICSSCVFTLAEGFEYRGVPTFAIDCLREGVRLCRDSVSALRRLRNNLDSSQGDDDNFTLLMETALSSFQLRLTERRIAGQQRMSIVYARLGDYRRSEAYAVGAASQCMLVVHDLSRQRLKIHELVSIDRSAFHMICQSASHRLLLEMKAKASPSYLVLESLRDDVALSALLADTQTGDAIDGITWKIDALWNLLNAGDLRYLSTIDHDTRFKQYYQAADNKMNSLQSSKMAASLWSAFSAQGCDSISLHALASLHCEVKLRYVRLLLSEPCERNEGIARDLCIAITETAASQAPCRAWAHYYIGLLFVKTSRQTGALYQLWIDHAAGVNDVKSQTNGNQDGHHAIVMARCHFREALALIGPASDVLSRDAMRSLALVAGPSMREEAVGISASALLHSSIGATSRQVVSSVVASDEKQDDVSDSILIDDHPDGCSDERLYHLFDALDAGLSELNERNKRIDFLYAQAGKSLPSNWRVVAIALCPTGEILISSLAASTDQSKSSMPDIDTVCIFSHIDNDSILNSTAYNDLMKPLDALISLNEDQISGLDVTTVADNFKEESAKRDWWNDRQRADDELQSLVENTESNYFSSDCVRRVFLGSHFDNEHDVSASCGNLASRFEEACTIADMTAENNVDDCSAEASHLNENCMLLILDENLHRFPFEGMEMCSKWAVSRIPSLPFAVAPLLESRSDDDKRSDFRPYIDPMDTSYIVDPEGNLSQTKKRLVPAIVDICDKHGWNWGAVIGTLPSEDFVQNAMTQRNGLLLYCGHGGATACFSRSQVEGLMKGTSRESSTRRCRSTIILMGCSSGKLVSVNCKDSKTTDKVTMFYEPEGIALSYLCAGAPCVVGNLWDVTDRDIDRYCISLLDKFLGHNKGRSLAKCVAEARSSCKMRHIVGLAPVCYGVPVHLLKH